jgi:two-component system repressor protein LuxO
MANNWPGNVRELQNVIRRAVVMNPGPVLSVTAFATPSATPAQTGISMTGEAAAHETSPLLADALAGMTLDAIERWAIEAAIARSGGNMRKAAQTLGLSPSTLYRKRERWADTLTQ